MNLVGLPELLLSFLKGLGTERLQSGQNPPEAFRPGAQYDAKILDVLPNGRNLVQVGSQAMNMALPRQAAAGEVVSLTFLHATPRPTFILNSSPISSAQPLSISSAAQQVSALVRYAPVSASAAVAVTSPGASGAGRPATGTVQASPSGATGIGASTRASAAGPASTPAVAHAAATAVTGRPILANPAILLAPAGNSATSNLPGPAIPAMTLAGEAVDGMRGARGAQSSSTTAQGVVSEKPVLAQMFPMRLQQTVKESGLFYESHLGKWVRGEMALDGIQREPQARLAHAPGARLDLADLEGMPEQAARLASRQLHMLEGGPFVWQGQVWPGQVADWQVQEHEREQAEDEAAGQKWRSQLRLALPRLGAVAADLDIGALGLRIRLRPDSPETLKEIEMALPELVQRLRAADLNLSSVQAELADAGT